MKRNSRSSISWEAPVLALLGLSLALSSWALYRDFAAGPARGRSGKPVGTIVYRQRQAERKYSGQVLWGSLAQSAPVYDLDTIRTAEESSATIYLEDKTSIELGEDSLVVLDLGGDSKKLDLSGGTIRVNREGGSGSLKVLTRSGDLAIEAGNVSLSDKGSTLSVAVAKGRAKLLPISAPKASGLAVSDAQAGMDLDPTRAVSVGADGSLAEAALEPVAPASGKELVALGGSAKVDFSWIGPAAFAGKLEISSDPGFAKGVEARSVSGSAASEELAPGSYYWRLRAQAVAGAPASGAAKSAQKGKVSRTFKLSVVASGAPRLLRPARASSLASPAGARRLVDFAWSPSPKAEGYRVEVSREVSFVNKELASESARSSLSTDALGEGRWYWRAVALFPAYGLEAPSQASSFTIAAAPAMPRGAWRADAPRPLRASVLAARAGELILPCQAQEGVDSYRVTLAKDEGFRERAYSGDSRSSAAAVSARLEAGRYYARVVPLVAGKEGEASEPLAIDLVEPEPIALLEPAKGASAHPDGGAIGFAWGDPNGGKRFKVELASDASFTSIVGTGTTAAQKASIRIPAGFSGELHWRVSSLDAKGSPLLSSTESSFLVPAELAAPAVISPADGEVIDVYRRRSFAFSWKPSMGATEYRLSLFRATGGALTPLREWRTDKTSVEVNDLDFLAVDAYAWKLVALGPSEGGSGAERESPPATNYFKVAQSSRVGAPKLKVPEIIYVH